MLCKCYISILRDLELRFGPKQKMSMSLSHLIPAVMPAEFNEEETEAAWKQLESGIAVYSGFLTDPTPAMKSEFFLWRRKWQKVPADDRPKSALSALDHCGQFLNMNMLLQLLATLPITTAEAERVFSKMEKTATAIRAAMEENRLEALLLLQILRDLTPSVQEVIDKFAAMGARRIKLKL